jgi:hypothetical protein
MILKNKVQPFRISTNNRKIIFREIKKDVKFNYFLAKPSAKAIFKEGTFINILQGKASRDAN